MVPIVYNSKFELRRRLRVARYYSCVCIPLESRNAAPRRRRVDERFALSFALSLVLPLCLFLGRWLAVLPDCAICR